MKWKLLLFLTFYCVFFSISQENEEVMVSIKDQIEIIDSYIESDVFSLDSEEFLDQIADHGAELNGYYEHERLKKIVRRIGMPNAMVITVFYFWNDQLIYVNYTQRQYMERKNESDHVVIDYSNSFVKFESKHFFNQKEEIDKAITGTPVPNIEPEEIFVDYALRMKSLLDNKFYNKKTYETLQGKWVNVQSPDEYVLFEETIRFNFREGKFLKKFKVKIKDDIMYCSSPKDEYVYQYKIKSLNQRELTVIDLQNSKQNQILYTKEE